MKFSINKETLLKPLSLAVGVIENRHTLPILGNVYLKIDNQILHLVGTDSEIQIASEISLEGDIEEGAITVPGKKMLDICKSLPDGQPISFSIEDNGAVIKSGRGRYVLTNLPADDFPLSPSSPEAHQLTVAAQDLKRLIESTSFAMAQSDVRFYLNGMLWELSEDRFRVVATDGHRLALCDLPQDGLSLDNKEQMIVPYKAIQELNRLLSEESEDVSISFDKNHMSIKAPSFSFTTKLVDGKFPNYEQVLPSNTNKEAQADRSALKECFSRVSILSNDKFKGVRLLISEALLTVSASNPDQEEAEEQLPIQYSGESLEIGFNVKYLTDVLGAIKEDSIQLLFSDGNSSAIIQGVENQDALYVVMPMRL